MSSILISDPVDEQCVDIFKAEGFAVSYAPDLNRAELLRRVADVDALVVRSQTKVSADVIEAARRLRVIGRAGAGVDNIDVEAATRRGIIVMNTPGGNTISTAEHTMSMILALVRNIPQAHASVREGKWERKKFVGAELHQKTLGIIGLGKVGVEVARRSAAFGMNVIAFDPVLSADAAQKLDVELVDLEEVFRRSDIISIHSPLTLETKYLINEGSLAKCKRGVRIINCARGGIVDEKALLNAIESGMVAGAALDVYEVEPPQLSPLITHPKVVCTPHLGASTEEAQEKVAIQIAHQVIDLLKDRGVVGSVNADVVQIAMKKEIRVYLVLSEKIGKLIAQLMEGTLHSITIECHGALFKDSLPAMAAALTKGILETVLSEPVNLLNAPVFARERGINVSVTSHGESERYSQLLSVRYKTDKESRCFAGTVLGSDDVRIVDIDGFHFEFKPEGNLLLYYNIDRPGMLASVSAVLARANINIAGLSLGRHNLGDKALTIVSTDMPVSDHVLQEIESLDGVSSVRFTAL